MGRKRKVTLEDESDEPDKQGPQEEQNPYELKRQRIIEQNRQRLIALGIPAAVTGLNDALARQKPEPKKRVKREPKEPQQPTRASSRLRGEKAAKGQASELALFVINGNCPRCGKVMSRGFKPHLEGCKGTLPPPRDDEDDENEHTWLTALEASKEAAWKKRTDEKLSELQLDGLVESTKKAAKFVVLGSTENHYTVTLNDARHTCQCVDFRIRKRMCKHIRLVLTQLDIPDSPKEWQQAVEKKLDEAQNDALDQPLAQRAEAGQQERAADPAAEAPPDSHAADNAMATNFL